MGIVRFALRFPHTFYVMAALIVFLGVIAVRTMPADIFPEINIPVVSVIWSYSGLSTPEMEQRVSHLQPVFDQRQRQRHQEHGGADAQRAVGAENLLPARRQSRPRHRPDRVGDELDPRADAGRHPAAGHRRLQCLERADSAAQSLLGHLERAAALRLRHLPGAPGAGAGPRRHAADPGRRQVPSDHGRYRPGEARLARAHAARRGQCRQCAEPDPAVGNREDGRHAICGAHQCDAREHPGSQQHPDPHGERHHGVREGRGPGA